MNLFKFSNHFSFWIGFFIIWIQTLICFEILTFVDFDNVNDENGHSDSSDLSD